MLQIAILDDQREYIEKIEQITKKCLSSQGVVYELTSYTQEADLFDALNDNEYYDIFLLDMELKNMTGLQVAKVIRERYLESIIIYITNYVEYAIEAFEVNTYRYIPKNMLSERLPKAYRDLYPQIEEEKKEVYVIEKNHECEYISVRDIYCILKEKKYVKIVHKWGESSVRKSLAEVMEELNSTLEDRFLLIDRGCAVNIFQITSLKKQQVLLRNGLVFPVSRPRLNQVKEKIMKCRRG